MKRRASANDAEEKRKRSRLSPSEPPLTGPELFDFPEHQRYITSILSAGNLDGTPGYIVGKVFMKYPESEKTLRFVLSTEQSEVGDKTVRVQVVFGKQCSKLLRRRGIKLPLSHDIYLSLRGCSVASTGASANGAIATLKFTEKVLLKVLFPGGEDMNIDLWDDELLRPSKSVDSEWFNTPPEEPALAAETPKLSKKEKKRLRAKDYTEKQNANTKKDRSEIVNVQPEVAAPKPPAPQKQEEKVSVKEAVDPLLLKPGCRSTDASYTPLSNATRVSCFYNIVGVVYSDSYITQSSTGDYMCTLHLVDPGKRVRSNDSYLMETPAKVVCFAKVSSKWLPSVREGDIVVLHNVKASSFQGGTNLVGYNDKLQWAIYGPDGQLTHGDIPSDLSKDTLNDRGLPFSPFLQTEAPILLDYCSKLRQWWDAVQGKKKDFLGKTHQVGSQALTPPPERSARPWLTIKDASPNTISNGYFNCVVEVVHKHRSDQACSTLYVTDYTSNDQCPSYDQADWCLPGLAKSILRIELWDEAASFGHQMEVGEYYSFRNLRMRIANNGFYEAKMKELKISKLDPDVIGSKHAMLNGLLERKSKWAAKHKIEERLEKLEYTKIEDVEIRVRFNCIVEILLVDLLGGTGSARVYVTDYTANSLLPDPDLDMHFFDGLEKRVLKIMLRDSQAEKAKSLEPGNVCVFQKVMLKYFNRENIGDLGGEQRLIKRLNPGLPSHKALMEDFENRKKAFFGQRQGAAVARQPERSPSASATTSRPRALIEPSASERAPSPSSKPKICTSIRELQSRDGAVVLFGIRARVKWAKPRELWDCCRPYCSRCNKRIPPTQRACVACDDFDHEFIMYKYNFNLSIEDEDGSEMTVAVFDEALFLTDLPRTNLTRNPTALNEFRACFEAVAGNVLEYQDALCAGNEDIKLNTPLICFYGCRYEEEGRKVCQLLSYTR
ncbi:hypothetical protein F5878DRAFT_627393 [Lentinula raphanica]|uniref:Protection of telomeres protein 1 n=1 Tax=Lentinula raphanica TaxID=153919 RepID=A0AA38UEZ0_9AGAR|nr:hypothetical protein F5878DRAFT_627393 [Lentinula raphanica]